MKLYISIAAFIIISFSVIEDFASGEIDMRGTVFTLEQDKFIFISFVFFKLILSFGLVVFYYLEDRKKI